MKSLANRTISPLRKGDPPLNVKIREEYLKLLPDWEVVDREGIPRLERAFKFPDYLSGLDFTNQVGILAEEVDHHPAILLTWGRVVVSWWTHIFKDLSENDFILAARTEELYQKNLNIDQDLG
jgi:4a-hydroxytetrahydrobiopterin dehydratase